MKDNCNTINPADCQREFGSIQAHLQTQTDSINEIKTDIKSLTNCIKGNGHEGLITRIDRVEQENKRQIRKAYGFYVPLVLCLIAATVSVICTIISIM